LRRDHAKELGNAVPEKPILFMKPVSSYIKEGEAIQVINNYCNMTTIHNPAFPYAHIARVTTIIVTH